MNFDPMSMELSDASIILFFGVLSIFFTFGPLFMVVMGEFEKFQNNEVKEHISGRSNIDFMIKATIYLVTSFILFKLITGSFHIVFPDWGDIDTIIRKFWAMRVGSQDGDLDFERRAVISILQWCEIVNTFAMTMSFIVVATVFFLSATIANSMVGNYTDDTQKNTYGGVVVKILFTFMINWMAIVFYNGATKDVMNHPAGGPYDLAKIYTKQSIEEAGKTAYKMYKSGELS